MKFFLVSFFLFNCQYIKPYLPMDELKLIKKDFEFQKGKYSFKKNWSQKISQSRKKNKLQQASLVIQKDSIIVGENQFGLRSFRKKDGRIIWEKRIKGGVHSEMNLEKDILYFSSKEFFWAFHLKNKKVLWKTPVFFKLKSKPVFVANLVCFAGLRKLYCLNKKDGKKAWSFVSSKSSKKFNLDVYRQILKHKNQLFYLFSNSKLLAFKASNGKILWSYQFKDFGNELFLSDKIYKNHIFIANYGSYLLAFNRSKKKISWKKSYEIKAPALVKGSSLYFSTKNKILELDAKTAGLRSVLKKESSLVKLPILKHKKLLFVSEFQGSIRLYKDKLLASYRTGWGALSFKIDKNRLYLLSKGGSLVSLDIPSI